MPVQVGWYDDAQRVILGRFIGKWDVADFMAAIDRMALLARSESHSVHLMFDFSDSQSTPRDLLAGLHYSNRVQPSNQGIVVYVNANAVVKAFVLMAKRTGLPAAKYIYNAESCEEAYRVIVDKAHRLQNV